MTVRPIREVVDEAYAQALIATNGDRSKTARLLGVERYTVQRWINRVGWVDHVTVRERSVKIMSASLGVCVAVTKGPIEKKPITIFAIVQAEYDAMPQLSDREAFEADYQRRTGKRYPQCVICRGAGRDGRGHTSNNCRGVETPLVIKRRERTRQKRQTPRGFVLARRMMSASARAFVNDLANEKVVVDVDRPRAWSECRGSTGPCPFVACKHHLYLDVDPETGTIKINFPDKEPHELERCCSLREAEHGGLTLEDVGAVMNLTRERVRQVEASATTKLRAEVEKL